MPICMDSAQTKLHLQITTGKFLNLSDENIFQILGKQSKSNNRANNGAPRRSRTYIQQD